MTTSPYQPASPYQPVPPTPTSAAADTPAGARNLIIGGIVSGVAGLILGVVSVVLLLSSVVSAVGDQLTAPTNPFPGSSTLTLETGTYLIFQSTTSPARLTAESFTVHGPDGEPLNVTTPVVSETIGRPDGDTYESVAQFDALTPGAYEVVVSDFSGAGVAGVYIVAHGLGSAVAGRAWWGLGVAGGGLLVVLGIILVAVGLTQRRKARTALAPAYTGPYPAGYGYQQQQPYGFPPQPAPQPTPPPQAPPQPAAAPQPTVAPGPPPGWYPDPDPSRPGGQRYWDGSSWTMHTA